MRKAHKIRDNLLQLEIDVSSCLLKLLRVTMEMMKIMMQAQNNAIMATIAQK